MVSSVLVELVADGQEAPSITADVSKLGDCVFFVKGASRVGEEGMFCMEIKIRHASKLSDPMWLVLKTYSKVTGNRDTPPAYIKNAI